MLIKIILVQIALTRAQNANQYPQSGDAYAHPTYAHPLLGLTLIGTISACNVPQSISSMLLWDL